MLSAIVQYAPYEQKDSWSEPARQEFEAATIRVLEKYMPDIASRITASELLTPADIEEEFHITGGHWHHAELTLDQFLFVRPVSGAAQYAMPLDGLYLCGAASRECEYGQQGQDAATDNGVDDLGWTRLDGDGDG